LFYSKYLPIFTAINRKNMNENIDNLGKAMPHNGKLLTDYVLNNRINRAELARKLNKSNTSVYQYAESPSLQMNILWKASLALDHNFVAELGDLLPVAHRSKHETELENKIITLETELEKLKFELSIYKNIVGK